MVGRRDEQAGAGGAALGGRLRFRLERLGTAGRLTTDAHLAAIAIEYQCELCTNDVDFGRFPGLRRVNPLRA